MRTEREDRADQERTSLVPPSTPINFYSPQDPSPIISPWGRTSSSSLRTSSTRPSSVSLNNRISSSNHGGTESNGNEGFGISANHPFIQRVQNQSSRINLLQSSNSLYSSNSLHSSNRIQCVSVSPSLLCSGSQLTLSACEDGSQSFSSDPFKNILSLADSNISQAESILSSLGCERAGVQTDSEDDPASLGSDIESNIRKLEKTQAKINAALETFRTVQTGRIPLDTRIPLDPRLPLNPLNPRVPRVPRASTLDNAELYPSLPQSLGNRRDARHRVTYPQSRAELNQRKTSLDLQPVAAAEVKSSRKTSLFRRHSFNHSYKDKSQPKAAAEPTAADGRDSAVWGESDADSARNSAAYDDYAAFSDTEGSFSPLKNRIRGLLGSFGKGKKKLGKTPKRKPDAVLSMKDPMDSSADLTDSVSIGQLTELVKNLPANSFSGKAEPPPSSPAFLRPKAPKAHRSVTQNNSNDTFSSVSTNQSFNISSNRNSVISAASVSSESFDNDNNSASDENGTSTSSPQATNDDLSPEQRQERKLFFICREIMTSERVYVDVLRLLNIEFREFVTRARAESKSGIMPDADFVKLFSNLPELMMLNEDLLRDFEERVENWSKVKKIADVIVRKGPYLKLYTVFIRDFSAMNFHFEECCSRYPKFGKLVKEFEKLPRCQQLKLQHYMLKPVQRLPQYRMLLEDYLKHLDPDSEDFDDTTQALHIVSEAAEHANNTVKQGVGAHVHTDILVRSLVQPRIFTRILIDASVLQWRQLKTHSIYLKMCNSFLQVYLNNTIVTHILFTIAPNYRTKCASILIRVGSCCEQPH